MAAPTVSSPGDFIREELGKRGWGQQDLARIMGRPVGRINEIIHGKQAVSAEIAIELANALGADAQTWMNRETAYRLSLSTDNGEMVRKRARLYELAPIKDMQKRGWIPVTDNPDQLEQELLRFFDVDSLDCEPEINAVFRRSHPDEELNPAQRAWCFRVKQIARGIRVASFRLEKLDECAKRLRRLAAFPQEARKVPELLSSFGIRFVIVEPLFGSKIDGAALWLDSQSPIIALTMRFDRVDAFWHNLGHEFFHIKNEDAISIDSNLVGEDCLPSAAKNPIERRADMEAAGLFVPPKELESFILRNGPMYSKDQIIRFGNKIKMYPGIIVGQLQHRGEIGFHANREMLVKIRNIVVPTAITDGWGQTIDPRVFSNEIEKQAE
jgi:HTH-type transcriptional regulator/antitoxin HigA